MYEQHPSPSPLIVCIWRAIADHDGEYTDPANEYWSLGFIKHADGKMSVDLFGPSQRPRTLQGYKGEEYWGVEFHAHVTMGGMRKGDILDSSTSLPIEGDAVNIMGRRYRIPMYPDLEAFVAQLEEDGIIASDKRIYRAMQGDSAGFSERNRQRKFREVTGLSKKQIEQLSRARRAYYLLQQGNNPTETALIAGYSDQSHMIRSLKLLRGETPAQIIAYHLKGL